jgi:hypothetical protein
MNQPSDRLPAKTSLQSQLHADPHRRNCQRSVVVFGAFSKRCARLATLGTCSGVCDHSRRLIAIEFPHWSDVDVVPVDVEGWDYSTLRLGDDLSATTAER